MTAREVYYRYDALRTTNGIRVYVTEYQVVKHTPKGVWLARNGLADRALLEGEKRFVKHGAHKKFACATKAEARESFKARKQRQIKILKRQLREAQEALVWVEPEDLTEVSETTLRLSV